MLNNQDTSGTEPTALLGKVDSSGNVWNVLSSKQGEILKN